MLRNILLVAIGGAIGSVCRYLLSGINVASWPWGTFAVNILGLTDGTLFGCKCSYRHPSRVAEYECFRYH